MTDVTDVNQPAKRAAVKNYIASSWTQNCDFRAALITHKLSHDDVLLSSASVPSTFQTREHIFRGLEIQIKNYTHKSSIISRTLRLTGGVAFDVSNLVTSWEDTTIDRMQSAVWDFIFPISFSACYFIKLTAASSLISQIYLAGRSLKDHAETVHKLSFAQSYYFGKHIVNQLHTFDVYLTGQGETCTLNPLDIIQLISTPRPTN